MDYLSYLPLLAVLLFLGFSVRLISKKIKLPWTIILILLGVALKNISIGGQPLLIPSQLLILFTLFILTIVVFNDISTITMHEFSAYSEHALKMASMALIVNMLFLTFFSYVLFGFMGILPGILLALILSSTDITSVLFMFKENKATELMKYEALISTPVALIGSIIILVIMQNLSVTANLTGIYVLIKGVFVGVGTGIVFSILIFSLMSRFHHKHLSPMLLVFLAALSYLSAEFMHGYGIFAIAAYALIFETSFLEKKAELRSFSRNFSDFFSVLAFMLLGFILPSGITFLFMLKSLAFFIIYLILRMGSVYLALHDEFSFKDLFFVALTPTKGLTVAALALFLSEFSFIPKELPELIIIFLLVSIILSTLMAILAQNIFRKDIEE